MMERPWGIISESNAEGKIEIKKRKMDVGQERGTARGVLRR